MLPALPLALCLALNAASSSDASGTANEKEEEASPWDGSSVSVGTAFLAGNSQSFTLMGDLLAQYRSEGWEFLAEVSAVYGLAAAAGEEEVEPTAEWAHGMVRADRRLTSLLSAFAMVGGVVNHPASLEGRIEGELGLGFTLLDVQKDDAPLLLLRLYLGVHASNDYRFQFFPVPRDVPDLFNAGPGVGGRFQWAINERVSLSQTVAFYPNVVNDFRLLAYSDTELSSFLTEMLAVNLHLLIEHDSRPAPEKKTTDAALTVGLELQL